jgi:hypothetical protein
MLNWVILIAFHLYHTDSDETRRVSYRDTASIELFGIEKNKKILIDCRELLQNLHTMFVGWMRRMDSGSLFGIFTTGAATYQSTVNNNFTSGIKRDPSLQPLLHGIQDFLCDVDPWNSSLLGSSDSSAVSSPRGDVQGSSRDINPPKTPTTIARPLPTRQEVDAEIALLLEKDRRSRNSTTGAVSGPSSSLSSLQDSSASSAVPSPRGDDQGSPLNSVRPPNTLTTNVRRTIKLEKAEAGSRPSSPRDALRKVVFRKNGADEIASLRALGLLPNPEPGFNDDEAMKLLEQQSSERELLQMRIFLEENFMSSENPLTGENPVAFTTFVNSTKETPIPDLQKRLTTAIDIRRKKPASVPSTTQKANLTSYPPLQLIQLRKWLDNTPRTRISPPQGESPTTRTAKEFSNGKRGGNKHRTRKHQRIAPSHHNTKRKISNTSKPRENHKYTRKARPAGV